MPHDLISAGIIDYRCRRPEARTSGEDAIQVKARAGMNHISGSK